MCVCAYRVHTKNEMVPFKASPLWQQGRDAETQQAYCKAMEFAAGVKRGEAFIATAFEQKKTVSGLSATQFQSIGPMGMAAWSVCLTNLAWFCFS